MLDPKTLKQDEEGLYDAGVDFNIITTSVGAYHSIRPENYKTDWNRPSLASPHFCASYIRNDMLGTAPVHNVLYGFSSMGSNSLALSGAGDIYSHGTSLISQSEESEKYYGPEKQLYISAQNGKFKYNEMDFKRIQDGVKKSPDYILVFKRDGVIDNIEEAKKASSDWDNLPIVVIDVNKVLDRNIDKSISVLANGVSTAVDVGKINYSVGEKPVTRYFINAYGLGFDAKVLQLTNNLQHTFKGASWTYTLALFMTLFKNRSQVMEYEFDGGETFKGLSYTASMGNGCYTGGGLKQTPEAVPTDGLLDIMVVENLNLIKILKAIPLLFKGKLLEHNSVHLYKAKKIKFKHRN